MPSDRIRNIFNPFMPDREGRLPASVAYTLSLADRMKAHVTLRLFGHLYHAPYSFAPGFVGGLVEPANAEERTRMAQAEEVVKRDVIAAGIEYDLSSHHLAQVDMLHIATSQARLHDLTIVDAPHELLAAGRALVEDVLFHSGRPLIVVPVGITAFKASRILVAWDGTARAARALNDAMPFLARADHVEIVSIVNEKDLSKLVPGVEVAPHLARHGVKVEVVGLDAMGGNAGAALRERAQLAAIDMIVMGAFAHARWRQWVLGGVTDSMLTHAETAVFMSH